MKAIDPVTFGDLSKEQKSLFMRDTFEFASNNVCIYDNTKQYEDFIREFKLLTDTHCAIINCENDYIFISNTEKILTIFSNYNEILFPNTEIFGYDEGVYGLKITPEVILRYTSAKNADNIPNLKAALLKDSWRNDSSILEYNKDDIPFIILRGVTLVKGVILTPSYFYCDAQAIITQQLLNYKATCKSNVLSVNFPEKEGRGAVFSFREVPFHAYNARTGNDKICESIGLFKPDYEKPHWEVCNPLPSYLKQEKLIQNSSYSLLPEIKTRQKTDDYVDVLQLSLDKYIEICLSYQRTLNLTDRIKDSNGGVASDQTLDFSLQEIKKWSANVLPNPLFSTTFFKKISSETQIVGNMSSVALAKTN